MPRIKSSFLFVALLMAGCSFAPEYAVPQAPGPDQFKEAEAYKNYWQIASDQAGQVDKTAWWLIFNDDKLNALEEQAEKSNPTLQAAAARVQEADAVVRQTRADYYPQLDLNAGVSRGNAVAGSALPTTSTLYSALGTVSYEADFFGRIRNGVKAARANAAQQHELYMQALLFLHADVAQSYYSLLELDTEGDLLNQTIKSREESQKLVERQFKEGEASEQESLRAQVELSTTRADLAAVQQQRAIAEHALAILLGQAPAQFTQDFKKLPTTLPVVPTGLPSSVLERRPDIAAAQDALVASNARIGVAKAAFFPVIGLTAQGGLVSDDLHGLFSLNNDVWTIGPLLSLPIFDGGRRRAVVALNNAQFQENVAQYRGQVLTAFKEVEDNLSSLRLLGERSVQLYDAAQRAKKAENISQIRYREGETDFLEALDTQRDTIAAQRAYTQAQGQRFITTVNLIRALGGGWSQQTTLPQQATTPIQTPVVMSSLPPAAPTPPVPSAPQTAPLKQDMPQVTQPAPHYSAPVSTPPHTAKIPATDEMMNSDNPGSIIFDK